MDDNDNNNKPKAPGTPDASQANKPADENDLRRQLIDQLDKAADSVELSKNEEEILFYLAYKDG